MNSLLNRRGVGSSISLMLHEATKNHPGVREFLEAGDAAPPGAWYEQTLQAAPDAAWLPLAPHWQLQPEMDFDRVLSGRHSTRSFAPSALSLAELAAFWASAYPAQVRDPGYMPRPRPHQSPQPWNGHVTLARPVLLVQRVAGLEPGAYALDERRLALRRLQADAGEMAGLLRKACFQAEFRDAPVLCLMVGSMADAVERYGDRGYRYLLLENGVQLQRQGLAAAALGLGGCITGSFVQGAWDRWLGLDGFSAGVLNGYALGHKAFDPVAALAAANEGNSQ